MPSNTGAKKPVVPPAGGGATRAVPFVPGGDKGGGGKKGKDVGHRRPDETGMLEMVPLNTDEDKKEAAADPSATQFFAIPAPKAERAKPGMAPMAPMAVQSGPSGPTGVAPPMVRPPIGAGPGMAQGAPQPLVQGPVVSYGAPGGAASPFQVAGQGMQAAPPADASGRVQSNRIFAILFAMFLLVCAAVFVAVWFRPTGGGDKEEDVAKTDGDGDATGSKPAKKKREVADTGAPVEAPPPAAAPKKKPGGGSSGGASSAAAPKASGSPGTVRVTMADAGQATSIEVVCPSGFRARAALGGGSGSISGVPTEQCTLYFKGGAPAQFGPVRGGQSLSCNIIGTTAVCK